MRPALKVLAVACVVSGLLSACGEPRPSSPTAADLAKIDFTPDHTIVVDDEGFHPATLVVQSGDVLLLVNEGTGLHSFTAEERFDTGRMHPGEETTMVLTTPGEIPYSDLESPEHEGTLTVEERQDEG